MKSEPRFPLTAALVFIAAIAAMTPARGDFVDYSFSGTITNKSSTVTITNPSTGEPELVDLMPDVSVGDHISGFGSFANNFPPSPDDPPGFGVVLGPGSLSIGGLIPPGGGSASPTQLQVSLDPGTPPVPVHAGYPPALAMTPSSPICWSSPPADRLIASSYFTILSSLAGSCPCRRGSIPIRSRSAPSPNHRA